MGYHIGTDTGYQQEQGLLGWRCGCVQVRGLFVLFSSFLSLLCSLLSDFFGLFSGDHAIFARLAEVFSLWWSAGHYDYFWICILIVFRVCFLSTLRKPPVYWAHVVLCNCMVRCKEMWSQLPRCGLGEPCSGLERNSSSMCSIPGCADNISASLLAQPSPQTIVKPLKFPLACSCSYFRYRSCSVHFLFHR